MVDILGEWDSNYRRNFDKRIWTCENELIQMWKHHGRHKQTFSSWSDVPWVNQYFRIKKRKVRSLICVKVERRLPHLRSFCGSAKVPYWFKDPWLSYNHRYLMMRLWSSSPIAGNLAFSWGQMSRSFSSFIFQGTISQLNCLTRI